MEETAAGDSAAAAAVAALGLSAVGWVVEETAAGDLAAAAMCWEAVSTAAGDCQAVAVSATESPAVGFGVVVTAAEGKAAADGRRVAAVGSAAAGSASATAHSAAVDFLHRGSDEPICINSDPASLLCSPSKWSRHKGITP